MFASPLSAVFIEHIIFRVTRLGIDFSGVRIVLPGDYSWGSQGAPLCAHEREGEAWPRRNNYGGVQPRDFSQLHPAHERQQPSEAGKCVVLSSNFLAPGNKVRGIMFFHAPTTLRPLVSLAKVFIFKQAGGCNPLSAYA